MGDIKEHCEAIKGITRDSIGKIKDVATNCAQIEANIRNIRDKSVVFDNELKSIKEQLAHTTYKLEENKEQEAAKDVKMVIKEKEEEVKKLGESLDAVKKKVQLNSMELSNIKEDKRTKEGETEERQQSLEQNLLDVRTYVERMLQETNKQLAGITGEVESTDRKIKRCSADILDIINRQERATGDSSTALAALETQVRELQEQEVMRRVELAGEMLELRGGANDKQAEVLEKVQTAVDGVAGLRRETQGNMDKLESQVSLLHDAGAERERKAGIAMASLKDTLDSKVTGLETKVTGVLKEVEAVKKESKTGTETCTESMGKIQLKLAGFMQADETRAMQVKTVKEALERVEKEAGSWKKEDSNKKEKLKEELEGVLKNIDAVKSHVDTRVENMRKNMIDMIGNNEMKTGEIEQKLSKNKDLDTNFSRLSDIVENMQCRLENHQENNTQQIEQVNTSIKGLRKGLDTLSHESKQSGALNMINKQRRGWEEAREKAEQMSQIFDSLIITNDRPYVSCGLESPASCPGLLDFSQFELINKVGWDSEDLMFTILEPGVYMLQMGGSISGANVVAKMVNDDVEAEVVTLEGTKDTVFRCRSTIFTVEDDDHEAERLLVEVVEQGEEDVKVEKDFS